MANTPTALTTMRRVEEALGRDFGAHDVGLVFSRLSHDEAVKIVKAFPHADVNASTAGSSDMLSIKITPKLHVSLFLRERSPIQRSLTPVADAIIEEARRG